MVPHKNTKSDSKYNICLSGFVFSFFDIFKFSKMIIKSKHYFLHYNVFRLFYAKWKVNRHFHEVNISKNFERKDLPILILSNHVSWWDGIWIMYLNIRLLKRKLHFMMLDEQMKKNKLCNYVGG
jgi:1-acyl-sn-glycerol-3-phosphate acyltransferase